MDNGIALAGAAHEGLADKLKQEAQTDALLADYYGRVAEKECDACAEFQCDFCILGSGFSECGEGEYGRRQGEKHDPANASGE